MGPKASRELGRPELANLCHGTHFCPEEVKILYQHFKAISGALVDDGLIDKDEFKAALGMNAHNNLFCDRLFSLFDSNDDKRIDFAEFLSVLSVFCPKGSMEEKMKLSFKIYDFDGDGCITRDELLAMLQACLSENRLRLTPSQIDEILDATFREADLDGNGRIDYNEYRELVLRHPKMLKNMTINIPTLASPT
eukprot:tig00021348_g20570.t1